VDFLVVFYHEEPDEIAAATGALAQMTVDLNWQTEIAKALKQVLATPLPNGTLTALVQEKANRFVRDDAEAREFSSQSLREQQSGIRAGRRPIAGGQAI